MIGLSVSWESRPRATLSCFGQQILQGNLLFGPIVCPGGKICFTNMAPTSGRLHCCSSNLVSEYPVEMILLTVKTFQFTLAILWFVQWNCTDKTNTDIISREMGHEWENKKSEDACLCQGHISRPKMTDIGNHFNNWWLLQRIVRHF